jgi:hypothetical protein
MGYALILTITIVFSMWQQMTTMDLSRKQFSFSNCPRYPNDRHFDRNPRVSGSQSVKMNFIDKIYYKCLKHQENSPYINYLPRESQISADLIFSTISETNDGKRWMFASLHDRGSREILLCFMAFWDIENVFWRTFGIYNKQLGQKTFSISRETVLIWLLSVSHELINIVEK